VPTLLFAKSAFGNQSPGSLSTNQLVKNAFALESYYIHMLPPTAVIDHLLRAELAALAWKDAGSCSPRTAFDFGKNNDTSKCKALLPPSSRNPAAAEEAHRPFS
jgi:hypothetical protein